MRLIPRLTSAVALLVLLVALPGWAADLTLKVDKEKKVAAVTNTLTIPVTMLYLVGLDKRNLPLFARMGPKETVEVPLRFAMPKTVDHATCEIKEPPEGFKKPADGHFYHLTVAIQQ